jgi:hypothetical protein
MISRDPDYAKPLDDAKPSVALQAMNGVEAASQQVSEAILAGSQPGMPLRLRWRSWSAFWSDAAGKFHALAAF